MRHVSFLIKPASSLCNLACTYCFYHDVSTHRLFPSTGTMQQDTAHALIKQACHYAEPTHITFAFQGGEPTLAGLEFFKEFVSFVNQTKRIDHVIEYAIQSNGTRFNEDWYLFLKEHNFLVGVSIDGFKENHDQFRRDHHGQPTHQKIMETIDALRHHQIDFNVLTVLTDSLSQQPEKLYAFYKTHAFNYVQLIPCLAPLDDSHDPHALKPEGYAEFYKRFYDLWLTDYIQGDYMSVTLFDNIIPMLLGHPPSQCGMLGFCTPQFVIEANGDVYPCDFYVLDEYRSGNIKNDSLQSLLHHPNTQKFIREPKKNSPLCASCSFKSICHGNCKRMNTVLFTDTYCGYQDFLTHAYPSMLKISRDLAQKSIDNR